jgi:hypothetical protein
MPPDFPNGMRGRKIGTSWNKGLKLGSDWAYWKGKKLSKEHRKKLSESHKGKMAGTLNPNWKGGKHVGTNGYIIISNFDGTGKKMYEHRYVMMKFIGRRLKRDENVHHKDRNKLNNSIENLEIISPSEHGKHHFPKGSKFGIHGESNTL